MTFCYNLTRLFFSLLTQDNPLSSFILLTKLNPPSLPPKRVRRPVILQTLDEGLQAGRQITLISAPAGYGKTICAAEWFHTLKIPAVWLSLEPIDDEPLRFFIYFLTALQKALPELGQELAGVLNSGQFPPAESIPEVIINEILLKEQQILLVLDDFHNIQNPLILKVFQQIVNNQPTFLHLVLLTREDPSLPLAKLRAEGKLSEIRGKDLCFSNEQTRLFFREVFGLGLAERDLALLEKKIEGWPAGLQLTGLSLRNKNDPGLFLKNLSGSHHLFLSYLTEQVINQQPVETRRFLLQTSILERFSGDLCDALTLRKDSKTLLAELYRANLFLIPLDEEHKWYRYHHLFASLLAELREARETEQNIILHQRAGRWYRKAGMIPDAIQHTLKGQDYMSTAEMLEEHAAEMILQGYARTVDSWLQAIPPEWRSESPKTGLAFAWAYLLQGDYSRIETQIRELEKFFQQTSEKEKGSSLWAEWLVLKALMLYMHRDLPTCLQMAKKALEITSLENKRVRSLAHYVLASVYQVWKDYPQAEIHYERSIRSGRESGNRFAEIMSIISLSKIMQAAGQLQHTFETCNRTINRLEETGELPPLSAFLYLTLADIHYQRDQLEESFKITRRALKLSSLGGYNTSVIFCHVLLSRLFLAGQNLEAAEYEIQKALDLNPHPAPDYIHKDISAQLARVELSRKRPDSAFAALQKHGFSFQKIFSYPEFLAEETNPLSSGQLYNCSLQLLLSRKNNPTNLNHALVLAGQLAESSTPGNPFLVRLEALLLKARIHTRLGNSQAASEDLLLAIQLAEPEGYLRVFLEQGIELAQMLEELPRKLTVNQSDRGFIRKILRALANFNPSGEDKIIENEETLIEALTKRETEILRLMEAGLKYKEIAAELVISLNTVRYHVKAIYGKLQANNRAQAIKKARQNHIL